MAKLWNWLKGNSRSTEELAAARERVAKAQHALLPYSSALDAAARAQVQAAETQWHAARESEQRGDAESATTALASYGEVATQLEAVRHALAATRPDLVAGDLLARATALADELDDDERCRARLQVFAAHLEAQDVAAAETLLAPIQEDLEQQPLPALLLAFESVLYAAERQGLKAPWLAASRARVLALLHAAKDALEEGEVEPLFELLAAQVERKDFAAARATLPEITGDFHEEALKLLAEEAALAGDVGGAHELLDQIRSASVHRRAEAGMLVALAQGQAQGSRASEALSAARALTDPESRNTALAGIAAVQAHAGEIAAARALLGELEPAQHEEIELQIFEGQVARGELVAAAETFRALHTDTHRAQAWRRVADEVAKLEDDAAALELVQWIEDPFVQAGALESRAWARHRAGEAEASQNLFGMALQLAGEAARAQGQNPKHPGGVHAAWILLAARTQLALGDAQAALTCAMTFREQLDGAWEQFGAVCGSTGNLAALDVLSAGAPTNAQRATLLSAAADSLRRRAARQAAAERGAAKG